MRWLRRLFGFLPDSDPDEPPAPSPDLPSGSASGEVVVERYRSGERCTRAGRYEFDGFVDPPQRPRAIPYRLITLEVGELFPSFDVFESDCYWKRVQ